MKLASIYEDFASPAPAQLAPLPEDQRLEAYERGYGAGWDDAARSAEEERARVGAALARRLEDISFSVNEARAGIVRELRDLVAAIGDGLVPALAEGGFGQVLAEALGPRIARAADRPIEIAVAPDAAPRLGPLMPEVAGLQVRLAADPALGEGQAIIRVGREEEEIDMQPVIDEGRAALADWLERHLGAGTPPGAAPRAGDALSGRAETPRTAPDFEPADDAGTLRRRANG